MRGYLSTAMLLPAILAVTWAYPMPGSIPKDGKEIVPSTPDDIPPYDDKPHPDSKPSKPFPPEQQPFDPQPYPGTRPFSPSQDDPPSFEPESYPGSGPEHDQEPLRVRRSPKDNKNEVTVKDNPKKSAGIGENNKGLRRNKGEPQFGAIGSFPWY